MPSFYAVCDQSTPYISIGSLSKKRLLANPAVLPTSTAFGCAFSPDGTKLAVAHNAPPHITVYNTSDWSKIANPAVLPTGTANGCAFSPDGTKLAVAHGTSPYITVYNTSDLVLDSALMAQMRSTGGGRAVAFTQTGGLQLRGEVRDIDGYVASRKVRVYERSSGDIVAETTSSAVNGVYDVMVYEGNVAYDVQFMADPLENLNDLFFAKAIAGPP